MIQLNNLKLDDLIATVPLGYPTGLRSFDKATGGLRPGKLYLLGGASGDGKTSVMISLACQMAKAGHQVLYIGTEDDTTTIVSKIIANLSGVIIGPQLGDVDKQLAQSKCLDQTRPAYANFRRSAISNSLLLCGVK